MIACSSTLLLCKLKYQRYLATVTSTNSHHFLRTCQLDLFLQYNNSNIVRFLNLAVILVHHDFSRFHVQRWMWTISCVVCRHTRSVHDIIVNPKNHFGPSNRKLQWTPKFLDSQRFSVTQAKTFGVNTKPLTTVQRLLLFHRSNNEQQSGRISCVWGLLRILQM